MFTVIINHNTRYAYFFIIFIPTHFKLHKLLTNGKIKTNNLVIQHLLQVISWSSVA